MSRFVPRSFFEFALDRIDKAFERCVKDLYWVFFQKPDGI